MPLSPLEGTSFGEAAASPVISVTDAPLLLSHADVVELVTMKDAIAAVERSCKEEHDGGVIVGERQNLRFPGGWIRLMPAAMTRSGVFGFKEFHLVASDDGKREAHVRYTTHLFDLASGRHLASLDANYLTELRTGAAAAVGTDLLAPPDAKDAAVIGSGGEARSQLEALLAVRPIETVRVYSRNEERRERFAGEMSTRFSVDVVTVTSPQTAVDGADVVVVATLTDGVPALEGDWLERGQHVTSIGSTMPSQRELDVEVWRRADSIVVDTLGLFSESGDALAASEAQTLPMDRVRSLSELVASGSSGRTSDEEITLYKSVGTSIQDVAVAELVFRRAVSSGVGFRITDVNSVKTVVPN